MGSRGSEYERRRRDNALNLFKEVDKAFDKAYVHTDGKSDEENNANAKAYNEVWNKLYNSGLADEYIDWLTAGKPSDWKKDSKKEPESNPTPEPEPESTQEPASKSTNNNSGEIDTERLKNAFNAKTKKQADSQLLPSLQEAWQNMTEQEKIAVRSYTGKLAGELNSYLWNGQKPGSYSTTDEYYDGDIQKPLDYLTNALNKSELKQDTWLERGISMERLYSMLEINDTFEIADLITDGDVKTHKGFMSTSSGDIPNSYAKGHSVLLKVFAPKGTKGMYVNPVSKFGDNQLGLGSTTVNGHTVSKLLHDWDGKTSKLQGGEVETILQRGLNFKVVGQETNNGKLTVTIAIVN